FIPVLTIGTTIRNHGHKKRVPKLPWGGPKSPPLFQCPQEHRSKIIVMKRKLVPMLLCCLALSFTAEAQFFKKLKKAAKNAAERTIMNRTDEEVSKGTDNVLDSLTKSGK